MNPNNCCSPTQIFIYFGFFLPYMIIRSFIAIAGPQGIHLLEQVYNLINQIVLFGGIKCSQVGIWQMSSSLLVLPLYILSTGYNYYTLKRELRNAFFCNSIIGLISAIFSVHVIIQCGFFEKVFAGK